MDIISKSSDLLLQFDPSVGAWSFLSYLPIVGHTNNNQRQDGNLQINFATFTMKSWPTDLTIKHKFNSFQSHYSFEMLQSLGYIFTDKYLKSSDIENSFIQMERQSIEQFYIFCCSIHKRLKDNHCFPLDNQIKLPISNSNNNDCTILNLTPRNNRFLLIRSITLTPMRMLYNPLQPEIGNRAVRLRGAENYIRVYIREENNEVLDTLHPNIRSRFKKKMLTDGIMCMNKLYYCVGSSTSQMKNRSYWFTTLNNGETIDQIRIQFGNFSKVKNLATYVARVGQYFSTSVSTNICLNFIDTCPIVNDKPETYSSNLLYLVNRSWTYISSSSVKNPISPCTYQQKYNVYIIRDIKQNDYCFTDGCGLISLGLAQETAEKIGLSIIQLSDIPSVFQIRMAGCKGTLMIDPESSYDDYYIKIRESMVKFLSDDWTLEICEYSRPLPLSLNNQIIRLLADLGNELAVFESLQNRMSKLVLWHPPEDTYLNIFDSEIIDHQQSRYLNAKENLLKNKIPLPLDEARSLFGVADVTGKLQYGQCFIQYQTLTDNKKNKTYKVVQGTVLVTKNPCLYPGDIQKLQAVDVTALRHCLRDCIVFPTIGPRPHSDEISGSDLDGDQYWVYWGNELKIEKPIQPLAHSPANKMIVQTITNEMIIDYFLDMIQPNCYSIIADVHTVVTDKMENGTVSGECLELATLFYRAIDSPKTGEIINMDRVHQLKDKFCTSFPKFMMKFNQPIFESSSIIEKLYLKAKTIYIKRKDKYARYQLSVAYENRV